MARRCVSYGPRLQPHPAAAGDLQGQLYGAGLVAGFIVLQGRHRVGDDAAAGLEVDRAVFQEGRPERYAGVEAAVYAVVAGSTRVGAAARGLELVYDLHRPDLGRPRDGPGRKRRRQGVERREVLPQIPLHGRDDVHDVGVALDLHEALEFHGPDLAHPPEVVAAEVNEHDVLGPLLLVGEQLFGEPRVLLWRPAPRAGARDRAGHHPSALDAHERLGRGPDERQVPDLQVRHVRRGVYGPQAPVEQERVELTYLGREPLRRHDLEGVPGPDVLLGPLDRLLVALLREVRRDVEGPAVEAGCPPGEGRREALRHAPDVVGGPPVGGREALPLDVAQAPRVDEEDDEGVGDGEEGLGDAEVVGRG